jgi:hypothetical protein
LAVGSLVSEAATAEPPLPALAATESTATAEAPTTAKSTSAKSASTTVILESTPAAILAALESLAEPLAWRGLGDGARHEAAGGNNGGNGCEHNPRPAFDPGFDGCHG